MLAVLMTLYMPTHMLRKVHMGASTLHDDAAVAAGKLC